MMLAALLPLAGFCQQMTDDEEHSEYILAVDEFVPAPGQFVNTLPKSEAGDTPASMARKCTRCLANNKREMVCLGAYGGYITFHFDHSIVNMPGQRDLFIEGNAFQSAQYTTMAGGSSEPGIVMVSKDVNQNGLPDDPWYELAGSADVDSVGKVIYNYEITYTRDEMKDVPWTDNQGNGGVVGRNTYHAQEYYPTWLPASLTFKGTLLPPNGIDLKGNGRYWFLYFLREGYVDNRPNADREANSFDFDWAVDAERRPVTIDFVDFVRVYTAANQMCGSLGETSTEIMGAQDLHLDESIAAILDATSGIGSAIHSAKATAIFSLDGKCLETPRRGFNLMRMSDGTTKKIIIQ